MITFSGKAGSVYDGETLVGHVSCVYGVFRAWRLRNDVREVQSGFADAGEAKDWIQSSK